MWAQFGATLDTAAKVTLSGCMSADAKSAEAARYVSRSVSACAMSSFCGVNVVDPTQISTLATLLQVLDDQTLGCVLARLHYHCGRWTVWCSALVL